MRIQEKRACLRWRESDMALRFCSAGEEYALAILNHNDCAVCVRRAPECAAFAQNPGAAVDCSIANSRGQELWRGPLAKLQLAGACQDPTKMVLRAPKPDALALLREHCQNKPGSCAHAICFGQCEQGPEIIPHGHFRFALAKELISWLKSHPCRLNLSNIDSFDTAGLAALCLALDRQSSIVPPSRPEALQTFQSFMALRGA